MTVTGIKKTSRKIAPRFFSLLKTKNPEPRVKDIIAPINKIGEMNSGMPLLEM